MEKCLMWRTVKIIKQVITVKYSRRGRHSMGESKGESSNLEVTGKDSNGSS